MIIDLALHFEHSMGQPSILYRTMICSYCSKRSGGHFANFTSWACIDRFL